MSNIEPTGTLPALRPRVARLDAGMRQFGEAPREVAIVDSDGYLLCADDRARRYFEGPWLHRYGGRYYLSYSTGNTHLLCYAVSDSPYGPFVYQRVILQPVVGWSTHHSICEFEGAWCLYYHDAILSGGVTYLRSVNVTPLHHDADSRIRTIGPYGA